MQNQIKVLIVDDSFIYQKVLKDAFKNREEILITGIAENGKIALEKIKADPPDIVTLDIEMPVMNGIETLDKILEFNKNNPKINDIGVIMVSTLTRSGADITIECLNKGAFDFITKPVKMSPEEATEFLRSQLLTKIRFYHLTQKGKINESFSNVKEVRKPSTAIKRGKFQALMIGISTGGPKTLQQILPQIYNKIDIPILIVQHMPPNFTLSLVKSINRSCAGAAVEASDNMIVEQGRIYMAPGGKHMIVRKSNENITIGINENPPVAGCRPSTDVLFRSGATVFGADCIGCIMTGMGYDGTEGVKTLKRAGGYILAQDEKSSVVWGMPGSAIQTGLVDEVFNLDDLPQILNKLLHKV